MVGLEVDVHGTDGIDPGLPDRYRAKDGYPSGASSSRA